MTLASEAPGLLQNALYCTAQQSQLRHGSILVYGPIKDVAVQHGRWGIALDHMPDSCDHSSCAYQDVQDGARDPEDTMPR